MLRTVTFFPFGAILVSLIAFYFPETLNSFQSAIVPLLGLVMFGMGMTLTADEFKRVFLRPGIIGLGLLLQFLLMPLIAWLVGLLLKLPFPVLAGLVLVGACPGGTASNVICYLARGDVALSISMTSVSTLLAVILTPYLTWIYVGQKIPVPVWDMMVSIFRIIIIPVALGILINQYAGGRLQAFKKIFPVISMLAIILIIGIIVAINAPQLSEIILPVIFAVVLHNLVGLFAGYMIPRMLGLDRKICRTIAIEVGMQNSGLGVALAGKFFTAAAALPGAVFSIWHNLSGATLAAWWSRDNET